jgi:chemotaxis protein MotB
MARKKYDEVEGGAESHDRWLISYADFITLLFAFFVVMYAISVVNVGKYRVLSDSLGEAFGARPGVPQATSNIETLPLTSLVNRKRVEAARRERERLTALARQLNASLAPLVKSGKVRVTQTERGVKVDINASVLFEEGKAILGGDARATLGLVGGLLKNDAHAIEVEGHTDKQPIANSAFPSNWELSSVRASSVVRLFIENGIAEGRLTAVGHGANLPVAPNTDEAGRARNRRVSVMILASMPDESPVR